MASAYIFSIVISKLGHWQEFCLVNLFEVDKNLDINFYYAIMSFGQAVCLGMEGS